MEGYIKLQCDCCGAPIWGNICNYCGMRYQKTQNDPIPDQYFTTWTRSYMPYNYGYTSYSSTFRAPEKYF